MNNVASAFLGIPNRWLPVVTMAVALLSSLAMAQADEFVEDDYFCADQCVNCNLFWHGYEGCVTSRLPRWYAGADVVLLRRDIEDDVLPRAGGDIVFATLAGTDESALATNDFKDEYDAGIRVFFGYAINDWHRLEASYWGSYSFNGDMFVRGAGGPSFDFPFGDDGDFARIRFKSELDNAELNLRSRLSDCPAPLQLSLLFGFRYVNLEEEFSYRSDGMDVSSVDVNTDNDMFGIQVGLMAQWQTHPRSWLDYEIKGAVYTNRASFASTATDMGVPYAPMSASRDVSAFSVDMSLILNYHLTRSLSLRFGYNAMWLSGVALGAQNVQTDVNLLTMGPPKLDHGGVVVYHGPSFGVVLAY